MKILTRYILGEITGYSLLGGVLFTFILFMRYLLPLLELAVRGVATTGQLFHVVLCLLPTFLTLTIPMAVLVGILLGLSRMAADSEITAMRASGYGIVRITQVVSIFAAAAWLLGSVNSLLIAPSAAASLIRSESEFTGGAIIEVQPRVFYEDIKNYVLFAQDVEPGANGTAVWDHVFLADLSRPASPYILTASQATVVESTRQLTQLLLTDGTRHDTQPSNPSQYDVSTFSATSLPVETAQSDEDAHLTRRDTPMQAIGMRELWRLANAGHDKTSRAAARPYLIELHRRLSFPAACLVLMLVGVPLGISSRRGGKGAGFVITLLLVFVYYFLSSVGIAMARQDKVPAALGVWGANMLFGLVGALLIREMARGGSVIFALGAFVQRLSLFIDGLFKKRDTDDPADARSGITGRSRLLLQGLRRTFRTRFPLILDEYVMSSFLRNFVLVLATLVLLFVVFTFFELIGDIVKYRTPLITVGAYLLNLVPFVLYNVTPLCSLVAVLITFGTLNRTSELTAMKATGTSLYRIIAPALLAALLIAGGLFAFDEAYLPTANRRQEALLAQIKHRAAQTFLRPDRKWMAGQLTNATTGQPERPRIFYYTFFDPDKNVFANLTVFEFDPQTFRITRRIFAESAHWDDHVNRWVFENGWQRSFNGETVISYQPFTLTTFTEVREPPSYFKKEDRQTQEMSYSELSSYIDDLRQSGFDTMRLRVQLNRKLAYPLITLVLAIVAVPFSISAGKRGSLAGLGAALGVAICYWIVAGLFENLGNVNTLPAGVAAWTPDVLFAIAGTYLLLRSPT